MVSHEDPFSPRSWTPRTCLAICTRVPFFMLCLTLHTPPCTSCICPALHSRSSFALYAHVLHFFRVLFTLACSCHAFCAGVLHLLLVSHISPNCRDFSLVSAAYCSYPVLRARFLYFIHILHFPFIPYTAHASPLRLRFCARRFLAVKRDPYTL